MLASPGTPGFRLRTPIPLRFIHARKTAQYSVVKDLFGKRVIRFAHVCRSPGGEDASLHLLSELQPGDGQSMKCCHNAVKVTADLLVLTKEKESGSFHPAI